MRIGELSKLTGCKVVTIRYYESQGLLPEPGRSASNYRNYADGDVQRLNFIRNCRLLGIGIPEISKMIDYKEGRISGGSWIREIVQKRIKDVERQIAELVDLKMHLEFLAGEKSGNSAEIIDKLKQGEECPLCKKSLRKRAKTLSEPRVPRPTKKIS